MSDFLWPDIVLLCAFILLIQCADIVRPLLSARQGLWKHALVMVALVVSLFSFVVAIHVNMFVPTFLSRIHMHLSPMGYQHIQAQLSLAFTSCKIQICLLAIMIVLLWGVRRTLNIRSVPTWVLARDIL